MTPFAFLSLIFSILNGLGKLLQACYELEKNSDFNCYSCTDGYYSLKETAFSEKSFPTSDCIPKINSKLELEIFISDKDCSATSACNGTLEHPYDNFIYALDIIHNKTKIYTQAAVNIFLLGEEIYILHKDLDSAVKYYFRRSLIFLRISPFFCSKLNTMGCKADEEYVKVLFKTNKIIFFVSLVLEVNNVAFIGADMPLEEDNPPECYSEKKTCCDMSVNNGISAENLSDCYINTNQTRQIIDKNNIFGLFHSESLQSSKNITGIPYPQITLENCKFERISARPPTDFPRFSSIIQVAGNLLNLTIKNMIITDCSLAEGVLKQRPIANEIENEFAYSASVSIINMSIYNFQVIYYEKESIGFIISIAEFGGTLSLTKCSLSQTRNPNLIFLTINYINSAVEISDLYFGENENVNLIHCKGSKVLKLNGLTLTDSSTQIFKENSFVIIDQSEEVHISNILIQEFFIKLTNDSPYAFVITNVRNFTYFNEIYFERAVCLTISLESTHTRLQNLAFTEFFSNYRLLRSKNCSVIIENILFSFFEIEFDFVITMESYKESVKKILQVYNGHFSNIYFTKGYRSNGVFEWPVFTVRDEVLMKNLSVFNLSNIIFNEDLGFNNFFLAYSFNKLSFENVEFSYHRNGLNTLLFLFDITEIKLNNISFRNNDIFDYYLLVIICSNCNIYLSNVEVDKASFTLGSYIFQCKFGIFENFTHTEIANISPSPLKFGAYSYNYGLNVFFESGNIIIRNWIFTSSENRILSASRFFRFILNFDVTIQNVKMTVSEDPYNSPELHVLAAFFNTKIFLQDFTIKNFYCQSSRFGNVFYELGIISFFNSYAFLREVKSKYQVHVMDISIENCKYCSNGAIGFLNFETVSVKNISVIRSENSNGGAIAIYYGTAISIFNLSTKHTFASHYGGAIYLVGPNIITISNVFIFNTRAQFGGAIFLRDANLTILNLNCINSEGFLGGGALYAINSNLNIEGGQASNYLTQKDGGLAYIKKGKVHITGGFEGVAGFAGRGGVLFASEVSEIIIKNILASNCSAFEKGIFLLLEDCLKVLVENTSLIDLKSETGFGTMHVSANYKSSSFVVRNLLCLRLILLFSTLIHFENELDFKYNFEVDMSDIQIFSCRGSVAYFKSSKLILEHVYMLKNITVSESERDATSLESLDNAPEQAFTFDSTYLILKNFYFYGSSYKSHYLAFYNSHIIIYSFSFQLAKTHTAIKKSRFMISISKTTGRFLEISILGMEASSSGMLSVENSNIVLENGSVSKCHAYFTSCIEIYISSFRLSSLSFFENKGYFNGMINSRDSSIVIEYSEFKSNTNVERDMKASSEFAVNDITIFGKIEGVKSIIRFCRFFETNFGITILLNNTGLVISYCEFIAMSNEDINFQLKALRSLSSDVEIFYSNFSNFNSKQGGTLKAEHETNKGQAKNFSLHYSNIVNSTSDIGGAFSLIGLLRVNILNNRFSNNKALKNELGEFGNFGVGSFLCTLCEPSFFYLLDNLFLNNFADNWLATVFSNFKIQVARPFSAVDSNQYFNNTDGTDFQGNLSFLPLKIEFSKTSDSLTSQPLYHVNQSIDNANTIRIRSGQAIYLKFVLLDELNQKFKLDHLSSAEIKEFSNIKLKSFYITNRESLSYEAEIVFQNLFIKAELNKSFEMQLIISLNINFLYPEHRKLIAIDPLRINFFTLPCEVGDIIIEADSSCLKCPPGKYSIEDPMKNYHNESTKLKCLDCPSNAICPGGSTIIPQKGFWRFSNSSTLIIECLSKLSCSGIDDGHLTGEELTHGRCIGNSSGPLCYTCERGYGRFSKTGICRICANEIETYLKLAIVVLLYLIYSLIQIKLTFQLTSKSSAGILLKIIVTHFQQLSLISLVNVAWTPDFNALFSWQEALSLLTEDLLPLECLLQSLGYNIYTQKVLATNIYPIILSLVIIVAWVAFLVVISSRITSAYIKRVTTVAFFIVVVLLFPEVISKCLGLLTCISLDDSTSVKVLLYSPEVTCWSDEHISYLEYATVPGLITWGCLGPLIIAVFLWKNRNQIKALIDKGDKITAKYNKIDTSKSIKSNTLDNAMVLKFLFKGYSSKYFYWELVVFLKKLLLISIGCISDFFPSNLKGVILLILITHLLLIQMRCKPYESSNLNKVEFFSLLTTFFTANIGILMFSYDFKSLNSILVPIVIINNALFLSLWLYLFLKEIMVKKSILKLVSLIFKFLGRMRNKVLPHSENRLKVKLKF